MLDIKRIVNDRETVEKALLKRMKPEDLKLDELLELYKESQKVQAEFETARAEQNSYNVQMAKAEKGSEEFKEAVAELKRKATEVKELSEKAKKLQEKVALSLGDLPNTPFDYVVAGDKEENKVVKTFQEKPEFDFEIKDHVELGTSLEMLDFERAAKMAGTNFVLYRGLGAQLEWALINFFIAEHNAANYEFILPPHLLNRDSAYAAGQLPKFEDDVYWTQDGQCLVPTAETAIANLYRGEVLEEKILPKKLFAYTPCYRREAGSYRADERGTMRMHQFNKVEMFQYTTADQSEEALKELIARAENLVEKLGLHYQTSLLAAGDCSVAAAVTYDVEIWMPKSEKYQEVSSISNVTDYQSRRGNVKYKPADGGKPMHPHMLNASGLATSRLIVALMETYQNKDGSITVPEVLIPFMGGVDRITAQ
jgi:seryl-tRNA synthetase